MSEAMFRNIGIIGAGTVGSSWAAFFASKGLSVRVFDSQPAILEGVDEKITERVDLLSEKGLADAAPAEEGLDLLAICSSLEEVAGESDFIQESVSEDYEVKKPIYAALDRAAPADIILASSSSGLLMSELQEVMNHPERSLIAHPFNPPHLVPLVECVPGKKTSVETLEKTRSFYEGLGKIPVILQKEVPGHIANRLAAALWREAIDLVDQGVASVEDVDKALYAGPGIRWALMGQHLIYHLNGGEGGYESFINHIGKSFGPYWETMPTWTEIPAEAKRKIVEGVRDEVAGNTYEEFCDWRDEKLVELLKAIYQ